MNAVDAEAISRAVRTTTPVRRSRLLSWITGEDDYEDEAPAPPGSLAPPPPDVRREMLRLELAAEYANLQAEADAVVAGAQADARDASRRAEAPATERGAPTAEATGLAEPPALDDPESLDRPD